MLEMNLTLYMLALLNLLLVMYLIYMAVFYFKKNIFTIFYIITLLSYLSLPFIILYSIETKKDLPISLLMLAFPPTFLLTTIFSSELQKFPTRFSLYNKAKIYELSEFNDVSEIIKTSIVEMALSGIGGLIVIEGKEDVGKHILNKVDMDAIVSRELLLSIFNPSSPLHDGAVVIRKDRIKYAGAILEIQKLAGELISKHSAKIRKNLGTRHIAGVSLALDTDALVIIISEEDGTISISKNSSFEYGVPIEKLEESLKKHLSL